MMLALLVPALLPQAFAAPKAPGAVIPISCRQGECHWQQIRTVERVRGGASGVLRKITSRAGVSTYRDTAPERYGKAVRVRWDAAPRIDYVQCSKARPATVFRDEEGNFVVTRLRLSALAGYQYAAANLYMQVCHGLAPGRWRERGVANLGYRQTRSGQDRAASYAAMLKLLD